MNSGDESHSIDNLIQMLQDADPVIRIQAGFILGSLEGDAEPAVYILIQLLKYGDIHDRKLAATTLGQIGPVAEEAIPALLHAANDEEEDDAVSQLACWALEQIDLADFEPWAQAA
jgi:HEAT repeat protein